MSMFGAACSTTLKASAPEESAKEENSDFQTAVEKRTLHEGLFDIYQDTTNGSVKFAIQEDQLGKEFIYFGVTRDGVLDAGHFRGQYRDNKIIHIERYFDNIEFFHVNNQFFFDFKITLCGVSRTLLYGVILFVYN